MNYEKSNGTAKNVPDFQNTLFKGEIFMNCGFNFGNGGNCCWIIIILLVLWFCCGNNNSVWSGNGCGNSCGCDNNCGCC